MQATFGEVIQLAIGAIVGFGLSVGMDKHGISVFIKGTREKAFCYLICFCCAWIMGMTLIAHFLGE